MTDPTRMMNLATVSSVSRAKQLVKLLKRACIEASIPSENLQEIMIRVKQTDLRQSIEIVHKEEFDTTWLATAENGWCPECGSLNVSSAALRAKKERDKEFLEGEYYADLAIQKAGLFDSLLQLFVPKMVCEDCGNRWKKEKSS